MAFDKNTRNRLASFVADARDVIADEFTEQFQSLYGISAKGEIAPLESLGHLDEGGMATAALLRQRIEYLEKSHPDDKDGIKAAVARLAREQAFTVLNRLAAIRMAEKRGLIAESVGRGYQSKGFKVFETVAGSALGDTFHRYRRYLFCLFDELAIDLGILFDRRSPQALLFPQEPALLALLDLLNAADLDSLWAEDETIGWIYQYYNDPEERKKMRAESAAPRNSRELAVRNQFFTPRYVVEFLTDNTLGRIWYEMTQGKTQLAEQCRYLVRRPTEIFLAEGESAPEPPAQEGLSQEELLKQPVHISHRPIKDPREIRLLDPACGSMHFGLYAFDLFETIYEEAWDNGSCPALQDAYASKDDFLKDVPRLIIEHNIHGIDIDPRAVQIAGLSLWLRAQKAWQAQGVKPADRPRVRRSNIVCAEPMPGSPEMLEEFVVTLKPDLLGELVKTVFDKMQLAGEAGSLLKIEEEIRTAIDTARKEWLKQQDDLLTRKDGGQEEFFQTAEQQVIDALRAYAEQADADSYQRRLFADDAARGFAFIDLCRKRYDAVVMNPPFGEGTPELRVYISEHAANAKADVYVAFLSIWNRRLTIFGRIGAITPRSFIYQIDFHDFRKRELLACMQLPLIVELGFGELDGATNRTACYVIAPLGGQSEYSSYLNLSDSNSKSADLLKYSQRTPIPPWSTARLSEFDLPFSTQLLFRLSASFRSVLAELPRLDPVLGKSHTGARTGVTNIVNGLQTPSNFRYIRLSTEVAVTAIEKTWHPFSKPIHFAPYISEIACMVKWGGSGIEMKSEFVGRGISPSRYISGEDFYPSRGAFYPEVSERGIGASLLPFPTIPARMGMLVVGKQENGVPDDALVSLLNSIVAEGVLGLTTPERHHVPSYMGQIPWLSEPLIIDALAKHFWRMVELASVESPTELSCEFVCADLIANRNSTLRESVKRFTERCKNSISAMQMEQEKIDAQVLRAIGANDDDMKLLMEMSSRSSIEDWFPQSFSIKSNGQVDLLHSLLVYLVGCILGRWDLEKALTSESGSVRKINLHDGFPKCPPGMLQNAEGLPAEPKDVPGDYPLRISWPGILVDDENHPEDIVARVRESIEVIWKDRAESIEQEACGILGVKTLRDYFRRPAAFFADHLKRYSKSRRQAPIYWPLSTKSGSYTLWLYYHRLTDQTLHTCLADFLDPKIRKVQAELDALTGSGGGGTRAGELREFLDELHDLRDEIERVIKLPWKPNLNDGVLITASPLHKLFGLPKWQKDLKACWDKLTKGDYDWAHLAYTIWPARVEKACEKDRSIAIAHGLEHLCKTQPPKPKKKRGKKLVNDDAAGEELALTEED
jgi:hypothetical protein